jgi:hypothetical protein
LAQTITLWYNDFSKINVLEKIVCALYNHNRIAGGRASIPAAGLATGPIWTFARRSYSAPTNDWENSNRDRRFPFLLSLDCLPHCQGLSSWEVGLAAGGGKRALFKPLAEKTSLFD